MSIVSKALKEAKKLKKRATSKIKDVKSNLEGTVTSTKSNLQEASNEKERKKYIKKYGNEARVFFLLTGAGFSKKATCGIMGNLKVESGFNPKIHEHNGGSSSGKPQNGHGFGLAQWTFTSRQSRLMRYCKKHGYSYSSLRGQCAFIYYECKHFYGSSVFKPLSSKNCTVVEACEKFGKYYEGFGTDTQGLRNSYALTYWKRYKKAPAGSYSGDDEGGGGLEVHPEKLYSSDNFKYVTTAEEEKDIDVNGEASKAASSLTEAINKGIVGHLTNYDVGDYTVKNTSNYTGASIPDYELEGFTSRWAAAREKSRTKVYESISGSPLPVASALVEAPFIEVTIGGVTFGSYRGKKKYPNYIQAIDIKRTNGSINEYTISLVHQISPGDNPNYIDNLLSKNGYDTIGLRYGDSSSGATFQDTEAMLTGCNVSFNFVDCNITYTISATSLCASAATAKMTYPEQNAKPSTVIYNLLYSDPQNSLVSYFPGMRSQSVVNSKQLIPTNDKKVTIEKQEDINPFNYLTMLVSLMKNQSSSVSSSYFLTLDDSNLGSTFKITEVQTNQKIYSNAFMYEVNVGYPDDNIVYDFQISTNYAWAIAYNHNYNIPSYKYSIGNSGDIFKQSIPSMIEDADSYSNDSTLTDNILTELTDYPIEATLTVKGLLQPMMLMQYIKVNNVAFGNKRLTSGVYIVTGQEDTLSKNGFRTKLSLLRVAGVNEYISINGKVKTS